MGLLKFLTRVARGVGGVLRKVGSFGANAIRKIGQPLAAPIKAIANVAAGITGFAANPMGGAVMGLVNKGLDALGDGSAAKALDKVSNFGARLNTDPGGVVK